MGAGTGRQTAAILDMHAPRVEAKLRRLVRRLAVASVVLSVLVLLGSVLVWTDLSMPQIFGVSPQGILGQLRVIER